MTKQLLELRGIITVLNTSFTDDDEVESFRCLKVEVVPAENSGQVRGSA